MSAEQTGGAGSSIGAQEQVSAVDDAGDGLLVGPDSDVEPTLSVVMPTLNEEEGIRVCIDMIKEAVAELEVATEIVISDSSTDRTPEIAREMGAIVVEPEEGGYGNAYKYAFERVRGDYVAIGDADTTYDFGELPKLMDLALRDDVDMVLGSRLDGEIKPGAMPPLHQYVGNPLLTRFLNAFYDAGVSDAHSGMRVLSAETLEELDLQTGGMEFASEMIMDAAAKDMTIEEVPITYHERVGDATLESFTDGWRHVKFMLTNAPGYLFSLPAALSVLLGLGIVVASMTGAELGAVDFGLQTLIGGLVLSIVGFQVGSLGIFSAIAADPIKKPRDAITNVVLRHFTLESGATAGVVLAGVGVGFFAFTIANWSLQGSAAIPNLAWTLLAAAAVVIGLQTVFNSFFLSLLSQRTD